MNLEADITKFGLLVDRDIATVLRMVAIDIRNNIVRMNPVDTGYSRSQWRMSINQPDLSLDPPPARKSATLSAPVLGEALRDVEATTPIFIANSVHYIQYLEEGSSQQAPNGMIRVSLEAAKARIDQAVKRGFL